ncbi:MAG: hypothetical protein AAF602_25845, partial [Myxococcota bacterium]
MADLLPLVLTFPTAVFALALAIATAFWSFSLLAGVGADILDGFDVDLEVDVDADVDIDAEVDADVASPSGTWMALAQLLRLGRVPLTVTLTLLAFGGFVTSFLLTWLATEIAGGPLGALGAFGILVLALVGAALAANVGSQPLEPIFEVHEARSNRALVGEVCTVTTGRVDEGFGQAELVVDHDHLTVQVRCDTEGAELPRGSQALIVHFDTEREAFVVEPLADPIT